MSRLSRSWLGGRVLLAVALALVTSASAAASGPLISNPGHSTAVVSLHTSADSAVVLLHRHGGAGSAVAGLVPSSALKSLRLLIPAAHISAPRAARSTGASQPRGPPRQLSDN